jgi:hypothetical protein
VKLHFDWQVPLALARNKMLVVTDDDLKQIDDVPGIYYFARSFGNKSEPFYIGETLTLRQRLKNHLDTRRIADILRGMKVAGAPAISNGPRSFHFAYFKAKKGQKAKKALQIAQKFMIREAIAMNIPLLNSKLTVIRTHSLTFAGDGITASIFTNENSVAL